MTKLRRRVWRLSATVVGVCAITFVAYRVVPVNPETVGFAYLLFVLLISSTWGFVEAAVASLLASAMFNFFFFPPIGTLVIADPQNWVAVFSLFATALIGSRLSAVARKRALEAIERQEDVERLYTFSRAILLMDAAEPLPQQIAHKLSEVFDLGAVVLYDRRTDEVHRAGPSDFEGMEEQLREAALQGTFFTDPTHNRVITAVRLGSEPIASLALQGRPMPDSVIQGIANLVAIGLERGQAQDLAHQIEAARRTERLRTTLIDAMAHEFKTPLTSIRAATTSLLANPSQPESDATQLLKIADEEAGYLQQVIDDAVEMARLDSAEIDIQAEPSDLAAIAQEVARSIECASDGHMLEVRSSSDLPRVALDRRLTSLAIKQLLDNAAKYSPPGTRITMQLRHVDGAVVVDVIDQGTGIPPKEQGRIFQRFYRAPSSQQTIPGFGLGLSITQRIMHAHGGDLTVTSRPGETIFRMTFPLQRTGEQP